MIGEKIYSLESTTKWNHVMSMIWLYFMLFPTGTLFNISIPVLLILIFDRKNRNNQILVPLFILLLPTLALNITQPYMDIKSIVRLLSFALIFLTFASYKGEKILFPYVLFAVCYILLSQISIIFSIPYLANFYDSTYHISEMAFEKHSVDLSNVDVADVAVKTRLGGMFINPNNCASYISVAYAVGLCEAERDTLKQKILFYLFIAITMISTLITGSRTGFIVIAAITLYYLYSKGYSLRRYIILGVILGVPLVTWLLYEDLSDLSNVRAFNVSEGMEGSVGAKMSIFINYLSKCSNPIWWLFGAGDIMVTLDVYQLGMEGTDMDFGNIFIVFGFFFYVLYVLICIRIFRLLEPQYRVIMFVLLWSFSNSILISYRMCPVFFLALGLLYKRSCCGIENEKEKELCTC